MTISYLQRLADNYCKKHPGSADNINGFLRFVEENHEPSKKDYPMIHITPKKSDFQKWMDEHHIVAGHPIDTKRK
jgi:hypothetical protein